MNIYPTSGFTIQKKKKKQCLACKITAITAITATAPLGRVKLLLQLQDEMIKQRKLTEPYKGVIDCVQRTFKTEGLLPFWRGNLVSCIGFFPSQALNFAFKDKIQRMFKANATDPSWVKFTRNILSGACAGGLSLSFVYSFGVVHTKLATDTKRWYRGGKREYRGIIDVYRKTLASDGIQGLYRGFVISVVGIVIYRGCYFGFYDTLKPIVLNEDAGFLSSFCLGYGVSVASGLIAYPLDTIRGRMVMRVGQPVKYNGSFDCTVQILKHEGFMSLMKGASVNIIRGVAGAGVLVGFDKVKKMYIELRKNQHGVE